MSKFVFMASVVAVAIMAFTPGCASFGTADVTEVHVTLAPDGKLLIGNKSVDRAQLGHTLKSMGAGAETTVYVAIPANTPMSTVKVLTREVVAAGYPRVFCTGPRHAEVVLPKGAPSGTTAAPSVP